ncbi:MAG: DUF2723 domain-containing protein, partial [Chloroflexi bacterium]|nr:DUF2723 domain-containing protein [Chloroflexota bacterium]
IFLIAFHLTSSRLIAFIAAALFATNSAVWRQSGVASVAPLNFFLTGALVYALLLWREQRVSLSVPAFLFGLNFTHHYSVVLLLPAIAIFLFSARTTLPVIASREAAKQSPSNRGSGSLRFARLAMTKYAAIFITLPLLFYLYLPLRGSPEMQADPLGSIIGAIFGTGASATGYVRATLPEILDGLAGMLIYLHDSFSEIGLILIIVGALSVLRITKKEMPRLDARVAFFLALGTLAYFFLGALYGGEPDRYLSLPFFFLVFWFAIGAGAVESLVTSRKLQVAGFFSYVLRITFFAFLTLPIIFSFQTNFKNADWSNYDRVYKQWDEIFSLPIPRDATIVGNWGQSNAMYYFQRVENRRADVQVVGTLYDDEPQTRAAQATLADQRAIFLAPGLAPPRGEYRYALLGPLLQVRDAPRFTRPAPNRAEKNIALTSFLTLADYELTTALEPYRPTSNVSLTPNRTVRVSVTWRAEKQARDFLTRLMLFDPDARVIAQSDYAPVRGMERASRWQNGEYIADVYNVLIPAGAPPGAYELRMQILDAENKQPLSDAQKIAMVNVERITTLAREQIFMQHALDVNLDRLALWGYGAPETLRAGELLQFNLLWTARGKLDSDLEMDFALVDTNGNRVAAARRALIAFYPTREWRVGEILKADYDLRVPSDAPPGIYALIVSIGGKEIGVAKIKVTR